MKYLILIISTMLVLTNLAGSSDLHIPINIQKAYQNQTRSFDGKPGPNYWQNRAEYQISVEFLPQTRLLKGIERITYYNNSPDDLTKLVIHLFPNLYKRGISRDFYVQPADETEGVTISELIINGEKFDPSADSKIFEYTATLLIINLPNLLSAGGQIELNISWQYTLNEHSHMRTGVVDSSSFFIAYFYPRIAVYDDIDGWNEFEYMGTTEFYNDFGDFDVSVTVPGNFLVWATGTLQNADDVLKDKYLKRYRDAAISDEVIHIIDSTEYDNYNITKSNEKNTWKFKAENVNDVAFASSDHYLWDATSLVVDKKTGRRVMIDAAYNKDSKDFYQVNKIARQAIEFMSFQIPGVPFPFPKMTVFNGLDEMEYPMMVNDLSNAEMFDTFKLTSHEILHSYLPFYLGINETKYAWMDEGFTSFGDYLILSALVDPDKANFYHLTAYKNQIGYTLDTPIFSDSEFLKRPMYSYNSYPKPAAFFVVLKDLLGKDMFKKCLHEFINRWHGKHPMPYDMFFTFENISGQNLDWLIRPWFFEYGYVDIAISDVQQNGNNYEITFEKKGHYPAPVHFKINFDNGTNEIIKETALIWQDGKSIHNFKGNSSKKIKSVELLNTTLIDADLSNNIFEY